MHQKTGCDSPWSFIFMMESAHWDKGGFFCFCHSWCPKCKLQAQLEFYIIYYKTKVHLKSLLTFRNLILKIPTGSPCFVLLVHLSARSFCQQSIVCSSAVTNRTWTCAGAAQRVQSCPSRTAAGMASVCVGQHPVRKLGGSRSAAVERRNLLTVCRWERVSALLNLHYSTRCCCCCCWVTADFLIH